MTQDPASDAGATLLVVGAHPDDGELGCGGLLAKFSEEGHRVGIVDLTRGEMGTSGDADRRAQEAQTASEILGLSFHETLDFGDGCLMDTKDNRLKLAQVFRFYRPRLVATLYRRDRHPDHVAASALVRGASLLARLRKAPLEGDIHCVESVFYYPLHNPPSPSFVVDISKHFEKKRLALEAYHSQFVQPDRDPRYRYIGTKDYIRAFTARASYFGSLIRTEYGEGFMLDGPIRIDHPEKVMLNL